MKFFNSEKDNFFTKTNLILKLFESDFNLNFDWTSMNLLVSPVIISDKDRENGYIWTFRPFFRDFFVGKLVLLGEGNNFMGFMMI